MTLAILDVAGATLPDGLRFLTLGWWVIHMLAVVLVFVYGYRRGRRDERRERDQAAPTRTQPGAPPHSTTR